MASAMTVILIGINLLVSWRAFQAFRENDRPERFLFVPSGLHAGKGYLGAVLSNFSHADFSHLLFNMLSLYFFAPSVEAGLGPVRLLVIYVLTGVAALVAVYAFQRHNPTYRSLGASGSVAGVIFAAIVVYPSLNIYFFFIPIPIPGPIFAILYLVLSSVLMRRQLDNISHEAHIGGALAGLVLAGILAPAGFAPLLQRFGF